MWSSVGEDNNIKNINNNRASSSSSKSSSSCSSPSPLLPTPRRKTMEEVWNDINLPSLNDHPTRDLPKTNNHHNHNNNHNNFRGMIFQDFLARPFDKEPPKSGVTPISAAGDVSLFGSSAPPTPPTILCLNSGPEFHYLDENEALRPHQRLDNNSSDITSSFVASLNSPFDAFASSSALSPFCKKRVLDTEENTGDRRHKRMIKNRESAARSRARKQAYTNELELEVAHLMEENAKLRKQQQQLYIAAAAQLPKKHMLQRTSTAPF